MTWILVDGWGIGVWMQCSLWKCLKLLQFFLSKDLTNVELAWNWSEVLNKEEKLKRAKLPTIGAKIHSSLPTFNHIFFLNHFAKREKRLILRDKTQNFQRFGSVFWKFSWWSKKTNGKLCKKTNIYTHLDIEILKSHYNKIRISQKKIQPILKANSNPYPNNKSISIKLSMLLKYIWKKKILRGWKKKKLDEKSKDE